jgi:hypothetical protein
MQNMGKKLKLLTSVHWKGRDEDDNKGKNEYSNFSRTSSSLCQIQWKNEVFIAKVTSFQAWITIIPHQTVNEPSTVGYFKGLLDLSQ